MDKGFVQCNFRIMNEDTADHFLNFSMRSSMLKGAVEDKSDKPSEDPDFE